MKTETTHKYFELTPLKGIWAIVSARSKKEAIESYYANIRDCGMQSNIEPNVDCRELLSPSESTIEEKLKYFDLILWD